MFIHIVTLIPGDSTIDVRQLITETSLIYCWKTCMARYKVGTRIN